MYTNVLEQNSKRVSRESRESRDRVLGNLNQQETEEIVVYTWAIHGLKFQGSISLTKSRDRMNPNRAS